MSGGLGRAVRQGRQVAWIISLENKIQRLPDNCTNSSTFNCHQRNDYMYIASHRELLLTDKVLGY